MTHQTETLASQYDYGMRHPLLNEYYGYSDFFNYGYWSADTKSQQAACVNLLEKLLEFIPDKRGTMLDVACGMGATTRHLLTYYSPDRLSGLNISANQLRRARLNAPGCAFYVMDAARLGFGEAVFDNLICVEAAFHFDTRERFLREAWRVLKPEGRLVMSDILFLTLPGKRKRRLPAENFVTSLEQYQAAFLQAGFSQVEVIEAIEPCWGGFRRSLSRWGWQKLRAGGVDFGTWSKQMLRLLAGQVVIRHYLLVSATKR